MFTLPPSRIIVRQKIQRSPQQEPLRRPHLHPTGSGELHCPTRLMSTVRRSTRLTLPHVLPPAAAAPGRQEEVLAHRGQHPRQARRHCGRLHCAWDDDGTHSPHVARRGCQGGAHPRRVSSTKTPGVYSLHTQRVLRLGNCACMRMGACVRV